MDNSNNFKVWLRVLGDVHGWITRKSCLRGRTYKNLIQKAKFSVQLGDLTIDNYARVLKHIDPERHKVVLGNHENYDAPPVHSLGDFGTYSFPLNEGAFEFFFIRGAFSLDKAYRQTFGLFETGKSWWEEEELTWEQGYAAIDAYKEAKPRTVFTHTCPMELRHWLARDHRFLPEQCSPCRTEALLQSCFEAHQPELWVFAHWHMNWVYRKGRTVFMCLDELSYLDFDENGHLLTPRPQ